MFGLPYVWQYFGWRLFTKTNKRQALTKTWTTYLYRYYYQVELPAQQQTYFQKRSLIYQFQAKYQHHREQMKALSRFCYFFRTRGAWLLSYWHSDCSQLSLAQNPFQLSVLRTGVQGALWWAGYNLLRLSLEWLRRPQDFFIPHLFWLDLTVLVLLSAFGGGLIYLAQVTSPRKWRLVGWLYEKQY